MCNASVCSFDPFKNRDELHMLKLRVWKTLQFRTQHTYLLHCYLHTPYTPLRIRNIAEGDLFSKRKHFIFVRCSVADVFKCDTPTT
jgi:hypothetical protein